MRILVLLILCLLLVPLGAQPQVQQPPSNHFRPAATIAADNGTQGGFTGSVWNYLWTAILSLVTYFGVLVHSILNFTVNLTDQVLVSWTASITTGIWGGLWGPAVFVAVMGLTFIGAYFALATGDAIKAVVE